MTSRIIIDEVNNQNDIDYQIEEIEPATVILEAFNLVGVPHVYKNQGNINFSWIIEQNSGTFILQRLNHIFSNPELIMKNAQTWIEAQKDSPIKTVELVPTKTGANFFVYKDRYYRCIKFIEADNYRSISDLPEYKQIELAKEMGRGLAISHNFASKCNLQLENSLIGYRDTEFYLDQFQNALILRNYLTNERCKDIPFMEIFPFVEEMIQINRDFKAGKLNKSIIHGDTKIDNFLFQDGKASSLIDLDTVMSYTWLADVGDSLRSICNPMGEAEISPIINKNLYYACKNAFIENSNLPQNELDRIDEAAQSIALELAIRFLTDYVNGDIYFQIDKEKSPNLNLIRGLNQLQVFKQLKALA